MNVNLNNLKLFCRTIAFPPNLCYTDSGKKKQEKQLMQQDMQWLKPVMIETNKAQAFGMDPHSHDRVEFFYCKSGEMQCHYWISENLPPKVLKFHDSELCIIPPNLIHTIETSSSADYLVIEFISAPIPETYFKICKNFNFQKFIGTNCFIINDTSNLYALLDDLKLHYFDLRTHEKHDYTNAILFCILNRIDESVAYQKKFVQGNIYINSALSYITEHIKKNISIQNLSEHVGVSQQYLNRLFHQSFDLSITEYINMKKLTISLEYLRNTDYPIDQIASLAGFGSIQYFDKMFRKQYNCSPSKYRSENSQQVLRTSKLPETKYSKRDIFIDLL